ncbi:MAG: hypothetical protein XXXJIFNMEKO3_02354 [Candidatus Erwinia impunctatus]|nr:hypothetical protein XXXJIFNMEKO_02354 [Culicoides impunctatus]
MTLKIRRPAYRQPESWDEMPWGVFYRQALTRHLQPCLSKMFGYHLLKIGALSSEIDTSDCAIAHQVNVASSGPNVQVIAEPECLPFACKSIDACLLAHCLAWSKDPHAILREVDRVLIDDGWLIISGFNPLSILGAGKLLPGLYHRLPLNGRMFTQLRMMDWLQLLNYEVVQRTRCQIFPWHQAAEGGISTCFPAFGCLNIIVARKRTFPLTRIPAKTSRLPRTFTPVVGAVSRLPCSENLS